ncbi:unnamed protein product [Aphanomyces euteiches]
MKWLSICCVALLALSPSSVVEAKKCKKAVHTCKNGVTKVYPNPDNDCKFDLCPEDMDDDSSEAEATAEPAATTVAPKSQDKSMDVDLDKGEVLEWKALDGASVPELLRDAAKLAFDLYKEKTVCDELKIEYLSVERKNASDFIGTKNKSSKYNKVPTQSYHVVANVDCKLSGKDQVPGKFILNMEHHGKDLVKYYQLVECGHEEQWGQMVNWLTIRNGRAYCQTPTLKTEFDAQPLHYINAAASDPNSIINVIKKDNKYIAITGALVGLLGVVLIALVVALIRRRRGASKPAKWAKQNTPTKPVAKAKTDDEVVANEVNSTKGLVEGVSTKSNMEEIKI